MIAITDFYNLYEKTQLLLFDAIYISVGTGDFPRLKKMFPMYSDLLADIEFLRSKNIVKTVDPNFDFEKEVILHQKLLKSGFFKDLNHFNRLNNAIDRHRDGTPDYIRALSEAIGFGSELFIRFTALALRNKLNIHAIPLVEPACFKRLESITTVKQDVLEIVLNSFPLVDEDTPLEQIIDFRNDETARQKLLLLRQWMRKVSKDNLPANEVAEEYEYLLNEYKRFMRIQRIKYRAGVVQTFITSPLEILENLAKVKLKNLFDPFFSLHQKKIDLLEAEMSAPGREASYSFYIKERF